jgi:excisionase family DNA binding protein
MKTRAAQIDESALIESLQTEPPELVLNGIPVELADSNDGKHPSAERPMRMYTSEQAASLPHDPLPQSRKRSRGQSRTRIHPPLLFPPQTPKQMPKGATNALRRKPPESVKVAPDSKLLVSRVEAAQLLSISERGVDYLIAARRLPTRRIGGRVLIPVADLRKYARGDDPERIVS